MGLFESYRGPSAEGIIVIVSITDIDVANSVVLVRVDMNVPLTDDGDVADDTRIAESVPTIAHIISKGGKAVLVSHLGRPNGKADPKYSLKPVAQHLTRYFPATTVSFASSCVGDEALATIANTPFGGIVVLENVRFNAEEEQNSPEFCLQLRQLADVYCNDAFGSAHRAHASTTGVASLFAVRCAGLLMQKELNFLGAALQNPKRPFVAIVGGSKISGKIDIIDALLNVCNTILVGGGMMFTFLKAMGHSVGASLVENAKLDVARSVMAKAQQRGVRFVLPTDTLAADRFAEDATYRVVDVTSIPEGSMGLDIGPNTCTEFSTVIQDAATVLWNGPMGVFEFNRFSMGTQAIAKAMANATEAGATTIVGGGDSAAAIVQFGYAKNVSHVSTGGGASLEFLEGKVLPGVAALTLN
jgi:phosphoglycerate kinase